MQNLITFDQTSYTNTIRILKKRIMKGIQLFQIKPKHLIIRQKVTIFIKPITSTFPRRRIFSFQFQKKSIFHTFYLNKCPPNTFINWNITRAKRGLAPIFITYYWRPKKNSNLARPIFPILRRTHGECLFNDAIDIVEKVAGNLKWDEGGFFVGVSSAVVIGCVIERGLLLDDVKGVDGVLTRRCNIDDGVVVDQMVEGTDSSEKTTMMVVTVMMVAVVAGVVGLGYVVKRKEEEEMTTHSNNP
ncbi:hypothetical protein AAHE18_18G071800 [Arachis hypogaea]